MTGTAKAEATFHPDGRSSLAGRVATLEGLEGSFGPR